MNLKLNPPFEVICENASDRPNEIPISKWLVAKRSYTVIKVEKMNAQNNILGFVLKELDISDCFPYSNFAASRFGLPTHVLQLAEIEAQINRVETMEEISV